MTHVHHLQIGNGANQVWNSPESDAPLALALSTWQPRGPSLHVDLEMLKIEAFFSFRGNRQFPARLPWKMATKDRANLTEGGGGGGGAWNLAHRWRRRWWLPVLFDGKTIFPSASSSSLRQKDFRPNYTVHEQWRNFFPPVLAVPRSSQVNGIMTAEYWWESTTSTGVPPRVHWGGKSGPGKSWLFSNAEERKGVSSDFADENHVALFSQCGWLLSRPRQWRNPPVFTRRSGSAYVTDFALEQISK